MPTDHDAKLLKVTVQNGDLSFIRQPLLIGHYSSTKLTGTERVMNERIGKSMEEALALGHYPNAPETCQVFINTNAPIENPLKPPSPQAVIVVGLGDEGKLRGPELSDSVRRGVVAWSQWTREQPGNRDLSFGLAATLIGSGGLGISVGRSAQFIVDGVCEANDALRKKRWPFAERLCLIELYLDRATEAWRALRVLLGELASSADDDTLVPVDVTRARFALQRAVTGGTAPLKRPLEAGYRGAGYDIVSVGSELAPDGDAIISFTLNTKRARTEVTACATQRNLVQRLVRDASNHEVIDDKLRTALYKLLIPAELDAFLVSSSELQLQLTSDTASIPWELLDPGGDGVGDRKPWAIRNKLIRTLSTQQSSEQRRDADANDSVLVIGEPLVTDQRYPPLPAARREAKEVADALEAAKLDPDRLTRLFPDEETSQLPADASTVIKTLFSRPWRIIHISGHGKEPERTNASAVPSESTTQDAPSQGVLLSDNQVLGPKELSKLRPVPELVFLNCCHLSRGSSEDVLRAAPSFDRSKFASSAAEALINIGVRCVIAAGWAVEDEPASAFAKAFYGALMSGSRFIDAVGKAREAAFAKDSNTWAAYQCYGDPDWYFRKAGSDAETSAGSEDDDAMAVVSPSGLRLILHTISVQSTYPTTDLRHQRERLQRLEDSFATRWGTIGSVAEGFGASWAEAGDRQRAVEWYRKARDAPDGTASWKAAEQLANLGARLAWEELDAVLRKQRLVFPYETEVPLAALTEAAAERVRTAAGVARDRVGECVQLLTKLKDVRTTSERCSLLGSCYKRLAMIEAAAGDAQAAERAVEKMLASYQEAERVSKETKGDVFYPASNVFATEIAQNAGRPGWTGPKAERVQLLRKTLEESDASPSFWTKAGLIELSIYESLVAGKLADAVVDITRKYSDLQGRIAARRFWSTTYDHMRFVLQRYVCATPPPERQSAQRLLHQLAVWADAT